MEFAITLSIYLGSKINIIGLEGNGLAKLMCNENSHWDGKDQIMKNITRYFTPMI